MQRFELLFKTDILVNSDITGLVLLIQSKKRAFVMLTERWSVSLFWKPLFMTVSTYFWLSNNTQYFRQLVLSLMHSNALSAFISSLPCTCYGLDYTPLKVVPKITAAHSGWMKNPSELHSGAECSNSQRSSMPVGGWLQRKLDQELNHMVQSIIHGTLTVSSQTKALIW